jgi:outer membrane biosynthesis protein TonB
MTTSSPLFAASNLRQKTFSMKVRGLFLFLVLGLHFGVGSWIIHATQSPQKMAPKVIEVVMLPPIEKPKVLPEKPPAPPVVKKEPVKPVVKPATVKPPEPVKKVTPPKPVAQPKILTSASENAETSISKVDTTSVLTQTMPTPNVTKSVSKPAEFDTQSTGNSSTGGECDNCQNIERRLKRKNERWRLEGAVTFTLSIDEKGQVNDVNVKNTEPDNVFDADLLAEIKEIVMEMEFTPKIVNDKAIGFKGTKTFKFQIQK